MTVARTTKLDPALDRAIDALAARRGAPRSVIVREALEAYVRARGRGRSFAEQARDLAGSVRGPRDLSTSRRHLRGYGE